MDNKELKRCRCKEWGVVFEFSSDDTYGKCPSCSRCFPNPYALVKSPYMDKNFVKIESCIEWGYYEESFNLNDKYERDCFYQFCYLEQEINKNEGSAIIFSFPVVIFIIGLAVAVCAESFIVLIVIGVMSFLLLMILLSYSKGKDDEKYRLTRLYEKCEFNYIKYDIVKNGGRVVYSHEGTGTISYVNSKGERHSIAVYRGYNSH